MKTFALVLIAASSLGSLWAGPLIMQPASPTAVVPSGYFRDEELFFDVYGSYLERSDGGHCDCAGDHEGFGGGISLGNYFNPYFGARADVNFSSVEEARTVIGADLLFRYLFREARVAPYAFVGGGVEAVSGAHGFVRVGGGLEWRLTSRIGLFSEASYAWVSTDESAENLLIKVGMRFIFY